MALNNRGQERIVLFDFGRQQVDEQRYNGASSGQLIRFD